MAIITASIIDQTLGAELAGVLGSTLLYGMTLMQSYNFFSSEARNPLRLKVLVGTACLFESIHMVLVWAYLYNITVTHFGNILALNSIPWMFDASLMVHEVVSALVQVFFTYRIYVISGRLWLVIPLYALVLFEFAVTAVIVAFATTSSGFLDFKSKYNYLVYMVLISGAAIDFINTTLLCWYLKAMESGFDTTRRVVNSLSLYALETGMLTTMATIVTMALWLTKPSSGLWVASLMISSKLYSNSLLGALNARKKMRSVLASSAAGATFPSFRTPRSNRTSAMKKTIGAAPLEPLAFVNYTDAEQSFAVATAGVDGTRAYELERGMYELEKSTPTMGAMTDRNCEDVIYNDDEALYVGSHIKVNETNNETEIGHAV